MIEKFEITPKIAYLSTWNRLVYKIMDASQKKFYTPPTTDVSELVLDGQILQISGFRDGGGYGDEYDL